MKKPITLLLVLFGLLPARLLSQDTFSIVAVDSVTGEVGSAGASCVDLLLFFPNYAVDFLGDLLPGQGAINTQASYNITNQSNARARMLAGDTPPQIISWLAANDAGGNPNSRQYGVAAFVNGSPQTAGYTGTGTLNYKNHIAGPNYCIQGNILLGQSILDSMEARFLNEPGDLACKLMAALQGAKVVGADTRCASNNSSSLFAFLKVSQPNDPYGSPSLLVTVKTPGGAQIEPIDSLQILFNAQQSCSPTALTTLNNDEWNIYPNPANDYIKVATTIGMQSGITANYLIIDATGRTVLTGKVESSKIILDISNLVPGSYWIELTTSGKTVRRTFMKQ